MGILLSEQAQLLVCDVEGACLKEALLTLAQRRSGAVKIDNTQLDPLFDDTCNGNAACGFRCLRGVMSGAIVKLAATKQSPSN